MKISTIIVTTVFAMLAGAASAEPAQVKVGFADLNLAAPAGQEALAQRIDIAARKVCNVDASERLLPISMAAHQCYSDAVAKTNFAIASATAPVLASR